MSGWSLLLIAALLVVIVGIILVFFLPQREGGRIKAFSVEVSAPGAGLVLIIVGLAAGVVAAPNAQLAIPTAPTPTTAPITPASMTMAAPTTNTPLSTAGVPLPTTATTATDDPCPTNTIQTLSARVKSVLGEGFTKVLTNHPELGLPCLPANDKPVFDDFDGNTYVWLMPTTTHPHRALLAWRSDDENGSCPNTTRDCLNTNHLISWESGNLSVADDLRQFVMNHIEYQVKYRNYSDGSGKAVDSSGVQELPYFGDQLSVFKDGAVAFWRSDLKLVQLIKWGKDTRED